MTWCDVVWCGVVWCGVVWYGVCIYGLLGWSQYIAVNNTKM